MEADPTSDNVGANKLFGGFISAQRRYDNHRVRDSQLDKRICYECGRILTSGEHEYQEHILTHEAIYLAYQLYYAETKQNIRKRKAEATNHTEEKKGVR